MKAFTLIELLVVIAIIALLIGILLPALGQARRSAQNVVAQANLRSLNAGAANYAGDSKDRIFSFSWRGGVPFINLKNGKERTVGSDSDAAAYQVQDILRRATGRMSGPGAIGVPSARLMHRRYSHLVLLDYLTDVQPEAIAASPFDKNLQRWQEDPLAYIEPGSGFPYRDGSSQGYDTPGLWNETPIVQLWPFASTYQMVPAAWTPDGVNGQLTVAPVDDTPHLMTVTSAGFNQLDMGRRVITDVAHPSGKVMLFEEFDRFSDPEGLYFAYPEAKCNLAFFDGSVRQEVTQDANAGWNPAEPDEVWRQIYVPLDTFPRPKEGLGNSKKYCMRYRWTRHGLKGVDFGGKDVGTNGNPALVSPECVE